jgi:predicted metal-dependent peptidase
MAAGNKSRAKLTESEKEFFRLILIRATSTNIGQPYIAPALFKLIPVSSPGLHTMAVDKFWRVYVDFEYMQERGVEFAAGVLAHEPWHLLRDHNARFANLDGDDHNPLAWNIAGDLEINDDIKKLIPSDSIFPGVDTFRKLEEYQMAEFYFNAVKDDKEIMDKFQAPQPDCSCGEDQQQQQGQPQPQNGDQDGGDDGEGDSDGGDQDGGDQNGNGTPDPNATGPGQPGQGNGTGPSDQDGDGNGDSSSQGGPTGAGHDPNCPVHGDGNGNGKQTIACGSGSGGTQIMDYELAEGEADAVDADEHGTIKKQIAENIKQYERSNPGTVPGTIAEWAANELAHKPINWRQALRGSFKQAISWKKGQVDYVRTRPHRRQPVSWTVRPALRAPQPKILVGIDTSGSNVHKLGIVIDEIENIVKSVGVRGTDLRAFAVDVQVGKPKMVNNPRKVLDGERMFGGTNMVEGYNFAATLKPKADIFVLLTDGETPWPTQRPKGHPMKYITVVITDSSRGWGGDVVKEAHEALDSWGSVIVVDIAEED